MPRLLLALALLVVLPGCGSPSYAGGPTDDDPHGLVIPGDDVTIWRVDDMDVPSRSATARLAPGRRRLKVRYEYPIESDATIPFEYEELELTIEDGRTYLIERTGEGPFGPYGVQVRASPR
jgi:hypothetical protein